MQRFTFKLESLLRLREQQQRICELEFATAESRCSEIQSQINSCEQDLSQLRDQMRQGVEQHSCSQLLAQTARGRYLSEQIAQYQEQLAAAQATMQEAREQLRESAQQKQRPISKLLVLAKMLKRSVTILKRSKHH